MINKTSAIPNSSKCIICGKSNHKTQECAYLKAYDLKAKEAKANALKRVDSKPEKNHSHQSLTETPVTKALTTVRRDIQVTDAPASNKYPKGSDKPLYRKVPPNYEAYKRLNKPKVNKYPHGYELLIGTNGKQRLQNTDQNLL